MRSPLSALDKTGDYASTAPMEVFTVNDGNRHPTELAGLVGKRLVIASEVEDGKRWNESRIKSLTGGDPVTARFMRQDFFQFIPQFKLFVVGNHRPGLRNVDEAIRRRIHLIPFEVTIPESDVDPELSEKLKAEWPGILHWALAGAARWLAEGLTAPAAVRAATDDYLWSQDSLQTWLEESCEESMAASDLVAILVASWRGWCDRSGEFSGSLKRFSQRMRDRGFAPSRQGGTGSAMLIGVRVRPDRSAGNSGDENAA
ncbi:MAG TPA: phage/plasmid primase, P4 family [Dongiaceae bacterium]|nr:phage/plasmid primase, P4 family [Dongiaceae bacterium]